jgi:hypothetical protein
MAAENIAAVTPLFSEKLGARILAVAEVELPSKYKTEGCEISEKQLIECGLTLGLVDIAWIVNAAYEAKAVEEPIAQVSIKNPSATPYPKAEAQVVKVQVYESVTTAKNKEVASESELAKKGKLTIAFIGR